MCFQYYFDNLAFTNQKSIISKMVKLICSYSTSSDFVVEPQYLLLKGAQSRSDTHISDGQFNSDTSRTSTELTITDVRLSDSALYYCVLRVGAQV
uniref:Immunoglobulin V-set domain-containing protein n=1 Tax=Cyprinus carpio TaxID=7962 RepID=A0A8C2FAS7_CYPCA